MKWLRQKIAQARSIRSNPSSRCCYPTLTLEVLESRVFLNAALFDWSGGDYPCEYGWTVTFGSLSDDYDVDVAVDNQSNVLLTGLFTGEVDFDPTAGTDIHVSSGQEDIYVSKINADGSYAWTVTFGGSGYDHQSGIAADAAGNIYVVGKFEGTANFAPQAGGDNHTSKGYTDVFVTKLNADGSYGWTATFGGALQDKGKGVVADSAGGVFVLGEFSDTVDFDPTEGTDNHNSNGKSDIFVTKLNNDGSYGWTATWGGSMFDNGEDMALDSAGNVFTTGYFYDEVDFDPTDQADNRISNGSADIFVTRLNADGSYGLTCTWGGDSLDYGKGVAVDAAGNVLVTGGFNRTVDFDPTDETDSHTSNGKDDIFVTKLSNDGSYSWTETFGSSEYDSSKDIAVDAAGNVLVAGWQDYLYYFLTMFNSDGSYGWTTSFGRWGHDHGYGIAADSRGNAFITGQFIGTVDFDPTEGTDNHSSIDGFGIFVTKLDLTNKTPTIGSLSVNPHPVIRGDKLTLTADNAGDSDGTVVGVRFYRDSDENGQFDPEADILLGEDADGSDGWSWTGATEDWPFGNYAFLARAQDNNDAWGYSATAATEVGKDQYPFFYHWTRTVGSGHGNDAAVDAAGNVYITGSFRNTTDFDPTAGTDEHTSNGSYDIFVTKLKADGSYGWTATFGGAKLDRGVSVAVDAADNVYVTGTFRDEADFDPGPEIDIHNSNGVGDIFVTKLHADGSYHWTKTFGGSSWDEGNGIAVDTSGNVLVTGYFEETVDFDPTAGTDIHTSSNNVEDIFVTKLHADGGYGWTVTFGSDGYDRGNDIAVDSAGNILLTGSFANTVDFNPAAETDYHTCRGYSDIFITKLFADGGYGWTAAFGVEENEYDGGNGIAADKSGNVYVTGSFSGEVDFDPSDGIDLHAGKGRNDIFVTKMLADGSYGWTAAFGGSEIDEGKNITVDSGGTVLVTGFFSNEADFDPIDGKDRFKSNGARDVFVTALDSDGDYGWTATFGSNILDEGGGVAASSENSIWVTGYFQGAVDFNPTLGTDVHDPLYPGSNIFVTKLTRGILTVPAGQQGYKMVKYTDPDGSAVKVKVAQGTADLFFAADTLEIIRKGKTATMAGEGITLTNIVLQQSSPKTRIEFGVKGGADNAADLGGIAGGDLGKLIGKKINLVGAINLQGSLGAILLNNLDTDAHIAVEGGIKKIISKQGTLNGAIRSGEHIGKIKFNDIDSALISARGNIKFVKSKTNIYKSYILAGYDIGPDVLLGSGDEVFNTVGATIGSIRTGRYGNFDYSYALAGIKPYNENDFTQILPPPGELWESAFEGVIKNANLGQVYKGDEAVGLYGLFAATKIGKVKINTTLSGIGLPDFQIEVLP